jgi:hypothetical protein
LVSGWVYHVSGGQSEGGRMVSFQMCCGIWEYGKTRFFPSF